MKNKKWIKFRHRVARRLFGALLYPYIRIKYGVKPKRFASEKRAFLVLYNHQTPFDQFFVALSFSDPVYFLASEDIFSKGAVSSVIRYLTAPIPIKQNTFDLYAVRKCMQVAKEGGTLAVAPEGNRTYSGRTGYMAETVAGLVKRLGLPVALYRIEGGCGVQPRWSDKTRKGSMRAYVARVIEPGEYASMTERELFEQIKRGLYVDENAPTGEYISKKSAEYLERAVYVCPYCGLSEFESRGTRIKCKKCLRELEYRADKTLKGVGFDFPFKYFGEWYDHQNRFISSLDPADYRDVPLFRDTASVYEVRFYKNKKRVFKNVPVALYGDRIVIDENAPGCVVFPFSALSAAAVLGRNKLNIYRGGEAYQFRGGKRFNALKYMNVYYLFKNIPLEDTDGKFLGL